MSAARGHGSRDESEVSKNETVYMIVWGKRAVFISSSQPLPHGEIMSAGMR